jgi:hypothetical protein
MTMTTLMTTMAHIEATAATTTWASAVASGSRRHFSCTRQWEIMAG